MPDVMAWLQAGLPLTLVVDLLDEAGPNSTRIYATEVPGAAPDPWWTAAVVGHVSHQLSASEPGTGRAQRLTMSRQQAAIRAVASQRGTPPRPRRGSSKLARD